MSEIIQQRATAKAPASIANLAVGFDILGQAFDGCHDLVTVTTTRKPGVRLGSVSGLYEMLPASIEDNTALRGAVALLRHARYPFGILVDIEKGIPKSAGLGGSAASSVGAVFALNALLPAPLGRDKLLPFALEGERASSDPPPKDNTAACLFGGLGMVISGQAERFVELPAPKGVSALVCHPEMTIKTGESRQKLLEQVPMAKTLDFSGRLAAFIHACHTNDIPLLQQSMQDVLIEPQRAASIPPFVAVQKAALQAGAICCSISGSGPSIFAWAKDKHMKKIASAMQNALLDFQMNATAYQSSLHAEAVALVKE